MAHSKQETASPAREDSHGNQEFSHRTPLDGEQRDVLFELFALVGSVLALVAQQINIYAWNANATCVAYTSITLLLFSRRLLWAFLGKHVHQSLKARWPTASLIVRLLICIPFITVAVRYALVLGALSDWRWMAALVGPLVVGATFASWRRLGRAKLEKSWKLSGAPEYRPSHMHVILYELIRTTSLSALERIYFVAVLPLVLGFATHFVYSPWRTIVFAAVTCVEGAVLATLATYRRYWEPLADSAAVLGRWEKCTRSGPQTWQRGQRWSRGSVVRHRKLTYVAVDSVNTAEPNNASSMWFWRLFRHPDRVIHRLTVLQILVIGAQLGLVLWSTHWVVVSAWSLYMFWGYATLCVLLHLKRRMLRLKYGDVAGRSTVETKKTL